MSSVLLVDDEVTVTMQLQERLQRMGYRVVGTAHSGDQAVAMARQHAPDVVLMDIVMPGPTDGIDASKRIRSELDIPVIFLTAYADKKFVDRAKYVEPFGYILKPFHESEIVAAIEVATHRTPAHKKLRKAEKKMQDSEERYRVLFNSTSDAVILQRIVSGGTDKTLEANDGALRMLGYSRKEFLSMHPLQLVDSAEREKILARVHLVQSRISILFESHFIAKNGRKVPVEINARLFTLRGESVLLFCARDITERKRTEQELQKVQKLDSIGTLASGIAHDFNNMLGAISAYAMRLQMHIADNKKGLQALASIQKTVSTASILIRQLLTFSKGGMPVKELTGLKELIKESASLALSGSNMKAEYKLGVDLLSVNADKGQIGQVIQNIVINADHAMPSGRIIKIIAENVSLEKGNKAALEQGQYVKIVIEDKGTGIPEKDLTKIFDPFFTTKARGHGLGLATAYSIIRNHQGNITVDSELGVGTTFEIYLPASQEKPLEEKKQKKALVSGAGKILVMDDHEDMRESMTEFLGGLGYNVVPAKDGAEAIKLYKAAMKSSSSVDVAILDLTVRGGMGGKETIKKLLKIDPDAKAIVLSGYDNDDVLTNYKKYGFKAASPKPFDGSKLTVTIARLIGKKKGS